MVYKIFKRIQNITLRHFVYIKDQKAITNKIQQEIGKELDPTNLEDLPEYIHTFV